VGIPLAILLLCLAGLMQCRQSRLDAVPEIGDPFDIAAWGHIDFDPAENAAVDYAATSRLYRGAHAPSWEDLERVWEHGWSAASPDVRTWLADNQTALNAWRDGTEKNMHVRVQPSEMTVMNCANVDGWRDLLQLAALEAERLRFLGDTAAAWEWHCASLRCTRHLGMNAPMTDRYTAARRYASYVERILPWSRDDTVTADQLAQALADVRAAWSLSSPLSASIRAEFFIKRDTSMLLELEEFREAINQYAHKESRVPSREDLLVNNEPEFTRRLLKHQITNLLEFADEPLARQPRLLPGDFAWFDFDPPSNSELLSPSEFQVALQDSKLEQYLLLRSFLLRFIHRERTYHRLLEMLLAAEWHRRVAGGFPATVDELLADPLLDEAPLDPMSRIEVPLRYERDPENPRRAKVWSVGDDGGSLEPVPFAGPADVGFWIGEPSSAAE
jgi:hypothetical protein